jgi:hypothetical protein
MGAFITAEEIQAGIPEPYRCYFLASAANNLTPEALPVVAAFWEAVKQSGQSLSIDSAENPLLIKLLQLKTPPNKSR